MLKLRQIEAFRAVMREGSMVRAGAVMAITQPAVSYLINGLETTVGFPLFSRQGGKLSPTPEAIQLMAEVDRVYEGLDEIEIAARQIANHQRAAIRIVITPSFSTGRIVNGLGRFVAEHPGLKLEIDVVSRSTILHRIESGQADIGILSLPPDADRGTGAKLFDSNFICVAASPGVLDGCGSVGPHDLEGTPMVSLRQGGVVRPIVDRWFARAGLIANHVIEVGDPRTAIELVRGGLGATIVSEFNVPQARDIGLVAVPLAPAPDPIEIGVMTAAARHPNRAVQALVQFLRLDNPL
jgi:DNA-binding transcriptional LysR family regulator